MTIAITRRMLIGGLAVSLVPVRANATPETMQAAIADATGGRALREGKVTLDIQPLIDNGNTVPMRVRVDSTMTGVDRVKALHVFNEKNPQPHVLSVRFGPRAGRAEIATRIKLADTQKVIAVAEMEDGTLWTAAIDVIVTIAACIEGLE
ncbi:MAG: SoxY-related AACIE arm protein [Alphaproteobacteria bacterium]|nr:SoxY-related AACIE arm protein [Alphaproteobacteria bacterium]